MRLGIGLGLFKAGLISAGVRIFSAFQTRVIGDGGTVESGNCVVNGIDGSALLQQASLLLIPSGYKGGKLYAEIPTNGNGDLTWTRGGDAFRTNASGVIQRVPWNLLTYSDAFNDASWSKLNGATVTANTATSPDGLTNADTLTFTSTADSRVEKTVSGLTSGASYTFSVYLRVASGTLSCRLYGIDTTTGNAITVTDQWTRYSITQTASGATRYPAIVGNGVAGSVFAYGAQLVEGTTAQTYLPTTDRLNFPRLSYMYGSCPSALLEPQRTNLALYSEQFNISGTWTNTIGGTGVTPTITTNSTTSPDNTQNAETIVFNRGAGNTILDLTAIQQSVTIPTTGAYILSVYAKASTAGDVGKQVFLRLGGGGLLVPITLTQNWVRYSRAETSVASGSQIIQIGNRGTITADNTVSVDLFGAQVEAGAYTTTYIPTTSATATRVADSAVKTGISSLIGQTEGTIFVDFYVSGIGANNINIYNNDRTPSTISTNAILFKPNGSIECQTFLGNGTFNTISITASTYTVGQRIKLAYRYKSGDFALYINGIQKATATNTLTFVGTKSQIYLDDNAVIYGYQEAVHYNQFALFTTALTNAELTQLTT